MQAQPAAETYEAIDSLEHVEAEVEAGARGQTTVTTDRHGRGWLVRRALLAADMVGLITSLFLAQALFTARDAIAPSPRL